MKTKLSILLSVLCLCVTLDAVKGDNLKNKVFLSVKGNLYDIKLIVEKDQITVDKDTFEYDDSNNVKLNVAVDHYLQANLGTFDSKKTKQLTDSRSMVVDALVYALDSIISKKKKDLTASKSSIIKDKVLSLESDKGKNIASVSLKSSTVPYFVIRNSRATSWAPKKGMATIKAASISFENGYIKDILVRACTSSKVDSVFNLSNKRYIPFRDAHDIDNLSTKNRNMLTFLYSQSSIVSVDLKDVLDFHRTETMGSGTYVCADTTFQFSDTKEVLPLTKSSIGSSLNLRIYTDPLGYEQNTPNGILQTEVQLNFMLNTTATHKKFFSEELNDARLSTNRCEWVWLNRISPYIKWMKMEKNNSILAIDRTKNYDMMELMKYAYLDMGTDMNMISFKSDSKLFTANIAVGLWRTKVGNDSIGENNFFVSTIYINPKVDFKFYESDRIDFSLCFGVYGAWQVNQITKDELLTAKTYLTSYSFMSNNFWGQLQQNINFHPGGNRYNSIFLRTNQYIGLANSHFTFQIGYSTPISNIFK